MGLETDNNPATGSDVPKKSPWKGRIGVICIAAVLIGALAAGLGIYNSPTNRLTRQLDLGQKYLLEQNYEQAIVAFDKAIEINPMSSEAYLGKANAYENLSDYDTAIAVLEKGYDAIGENEDINDGLIRNYLIRAKERVDNSKFGESLKDYDRLLELDATNENIIQDLSNCLSLYFDLLLKEKRYDELEQLIEKYKHAAKLDFNSILKEIEDAIEYDIFISDTEDLMSQIARLCQSEEYEDIFALMGEDRYEDLINNMTNLKSEKYIIDTNYGRIGIYKTDSIFYGNYMIYYGGYDGEVREGTGVWIGYYNKNNYIAHGTFAEDVPEGEFKVREWSTLLADDVVYRVITGNILKGHWDGNVLWAFEGDDGSRLEFPVTFNDGNWVVLGYTEGGAPIASKSGSGNSGIMTVVQKGEEIIQPLGIVGFSMEDR